ncbi:MAG: cation:proton antiporter, partial [Candidatus Omnitrophica bacterium]|nr:cation:proton antiporter [Candidatus Omnitrophota bacterium]
MASLTHHDITILFVSLGILLASARILGEIARLFQQPAVLGEIIAGILLGPTVFGFVFPNLHETLFPDEGAVLIALQGFTAIAIALFLMVAGMEVDLSTAWRQGKTASVVAFLGIVVPFTLGFVTTWFMEDLFSNGSKHPHLILSLFIATAMSISALPVIARILMDLNIYRTDLGMFVISAAILNDLAGWIIFGVLLGLIDTGGASTWTTGQVLILIVLFTGGMMTLGRGLFNR